MAGLALVAAMAVPDCLGASSEGFTLPVVDAKTGARLPGVLAIQVVRTGWGTGLESRANKENAILRETVSDASGNITFGPRTFVVNPLKLGNRIEGGALYLFKPGYCTGVWGDKNPHDYDDGVVLWTSSWHPAIKLRPCADRLEAVKDLLDMGPMWTLRQHLVDPMYGHCGWRSVPRFVAAVESERWRLLQGYRDPTRETPAGTATNSPFMEDILRQPPALACGGVEDLVAQVVVPCPGSGERMERVVWRTHSERPLEQGTRSRPVLTGWCPSSRLHWHYQDGRGWQSRKDPIPNEWITSDNPDPIPLHPSRRTRPQ
jgi:hypothetical protein